MSAEGGVRPNRTFGRKIKDISNDVETLYGLVNSIDSRSGVPTGIDLGTGSTALSSKSDSMPLAGGIFEGPYGSIAESISITGGNLKLNENASGDPLTVRRIIFVATESGTADDLDTIEGRLREGQEHVLVGVTGNTVTIKHDNTGAESNDERAILCPGDVDFELEGDNAITIFFDVVANKWKIIGNAGAGTGTGGGGGSSGGGTFITASMSADQLQSVDTGLAVGKHLEFDTLDEDGGIVLQTGTGQANGIFELIADRAYVLTGTLHPEFNTSNTVARFGWYDITNAANLGQAAEIRPYTHTVAEGAQPLASVVLKPTTNINVELRILSNTGFVTAVKEETWATIYEIGGGGLTEPIRQTVTPVTPQTEPTTTDIDVSIGNIYTIAVDRDITVDYTGTLPAALEYQLIHLIFTQDATGGRVVTWDAGITFTNGTPTVTETALAITDVVIYTKDQGVTWTWTVSSGGFSGTATQTPWTSDIDAALFNLNNLGGIDLNGASATIEGVVNLNLFQLNQSINSLAGALSYQGAALDKHSFVLGGTEALKIEEAAAGVYRLDMLNHTIIDAKDLRFDTSAVFALPGAVPGVAYDSAGNRIRVNVPTGDTILLEANSVGTGIQLNPNSGGGVTAATINADAVLQLGVDVNTPASPGEIRSDGTDVRVFSGGSVRNLSDIGGVGTFATIALDNLASTAVNAALIPDGLSTRDLGTELLPWRIGHFQQIEFPDPTTEPSGATDNQISVTTSTNEMAFNVDSLGAGFKFYFQGVNNWSISPTSLTGSNVVLSDTLTINDSSVNPAANGQFTRNGNVVAVQADEYAVRRVSTVGTDFSELTLMKVDGGPAAGDSVAAINFTNLDGGTLDQYARIQSTIANQSDAGRIQVEVRADNSTVLTPAIIARGAESSLNSYISMNGRIDSNLAFGQETGSTDLKIFPQINTFGITFDNLSYTVGSKGTLSIPPATTGVLTTIASLDAAFGDHFGCAGIVEIASTLTLFVKQNNGNWGTVGLTFDAITT